MVIKGQAGIGKTTLWRAAIESEREQHHTVLSARCVQAELPLGLAGLSDLLQDVLPAVTDEVADHGASALAVAIGLEAPEEGQRDAIALPRAFLALLRALARDRPVLVAIDDVQWLDAPSARVIAFAGRRLGDSRVAMLLTQRDGTSDPTDAASTFGEGFEELRLGPLSTGALAHLLRTRLGMRIPRPLLARVHDASGGNPMFALEFARAIGERDGSRLGPVPIPASLQSSYTRASSNSRPTSGVCSRSSGPAGSRLYRCSPRSTRLQARPSMPQWMPECSPSAPTRPSVSRIHYWPPRPTPIYRSRGAAQCTPRSRRP